MEVAELLIRKPALIRTRNGELPLDQPAVAETASARAALGGNLQTGALQRNKHRFPRIRFDRIRFEPDMHGERIFRRRNVAVSDAVCLFADTAQRQPEFLVSSSRKRYIACGPHIITVKSFCGTYFLISSAVIKPCS